jgi:hypothetical protein
MLPLVGKDETFRLPQWSVEVRRAVVAALLAASGDLQFRC